MARSPRPDPLTRSLRAHVQAVLAPGADAAAVRQAAQAVMRAAVQTRLERLGVAPAGSLFAAPEPAAPAIVPAAAEATFAQLAAIWPALLADPTRKQQGAWFTTDALVTPTVERTLAPRLADDPAALRIADPAVGGGAFLAAALRQLIAVGVPAAHAASNCLFGVDLDPTAAALAAWHLWEIAGTPDLDIAAIEAHVHAGDGLTTWTDGTFDAVLGNPPWETLQLQRAAGDAPIGDRDPQLLAARLRQLRARFRHQGSGKLFTYRLFVERAIALLRPRGRLGMIVPASLYFDEQARMLRQLLLDECRWEWLFGFENRRQLFPIDSRYRFAILVAQRGGPSTSVNTAFGRLDPEDWANPAPRHLVVHRDDVRTLSPQHGTLLEIDDAADLDLLRRLARNGRPLLGGHGLCTWRQGDFNMTTHLPWFRPRANAEADGWRRGDDGRWHREGDADVLLPLYQGTMVWDLHPNAAAHVGGAGRTAVWDTPGSATDLRPQYLIAAARFHAGGAPARLVLRALSNASNERTAVPALVPDAPCGNSLGVLTPRTGADDLLTLAFTAGVLASLVFDWSLRQRLAGTNLNGFVLSDLCVPDVGPADRMAIARVALQLAAILPWQQRVWQLAMHEGWLPAGWDWSTHAAVAPAARRRAFVELDHLVAQAWGVTAADLQRILADCGLPASALADRRATQRLPAKGFWRIDRDLPPGRRRTVQLLARFGAVQHG